MGGFWGGFARGWAEEEEKRNWLELQEERERRKELSSRLWDVAQDASGKWTDEARNRAFQMYGQVAATPHNKKLPKWISLDSLLRVKRTPVKGPDVPQWEVDPKDWKSPEIEEANRLNREAGGVAQGSRLSPEGQYREFDLRPFEEQVSQETGRPFEKTLIPQEAPPTTPRPYTRSGMLSQDEQDEAAISHKVDMQRRLWEAEQPFILEQIEARKKLEDSYFNKPYGSAYPASGQDIMNDFGIRDIGGVAIDPKAQYRVQPTYGSKMRGEMPLINSTLERPDTTATVAGSRVVVGEDGREELVMWDRSGRRMQSPLTDKERALLPMGAYSSFSTTDRKEFPLEDRVRSTVVRQRDLGALPRRGAAAPSTPVGVSPSGGTRMFRLYPRGHEPSFAAPPPTGGVPSRAPTPRPAAAPAAPAAAPDLGLPPGVLPSAPYTPPVMNAAPPQGVTPPGVVGTEQMPTPMGVMTQGVGGQSLMGTAELPRPEPADKRTLDLPAAPVRPVYTLAGDKMMNNEPVNQEIANEVKMSVLSKQAGVDVWIVDGDPRAKLGVPAIEDERLQGMPEEAKGLVASVLKNPDTLNNYKGKKHDALANLMELHGIPVAAKPTAQLLQTEEYARTTMQLVQSLRQIILRDKATVRIGPVAGRVGTVEQYVGDTISLTPAQADLAQRIRTRMTYLLAQEAKVLMGSRPALTWVETLKQASANVNMTLPMLLGSLDVAEFHARNVLDAGWQARFGGSVPRLDFDHDPRLPGSPKPGDRRAVYENDRLTIQELIRQEDPDSYAFIWVSPKSIARVDNSGNILEVDDEAKELSYVIPKRLQKSELPSVVKKPTKKR